jgi:hypothetical protein
MPLRPTLAMSANGTSVRGQVADEVPLSSRCGCAEAPNRAIWAYDYCPECVAGPLRRESCGPRSGLVDDH